MKKHWWHNSKYHTTFFSFLVSLGIISAGFVILYTGANLVWKSPLPLAPLSQVDRPVRLIIPSIKVDAHVQEAGLAASGRMAVPSNFTDVAWYKGGPKPGQSGSATIDGHLDTAMDANAVFARLSELKKGDDIQVVDKAGKKINFRVTETEVYDEATAPLAKIFDATGAPRLTLITCDGAWDQKTKNYDKRLVVYAELTN